MTKEYDPLNLKAFRGTRIKIFGTNADDPEKGRIFLRTKVGWFERIVDASGDLIFTPVTHSEEELLKFVAKGNPSVDLVQLSDEYQKKAYGELLEQLTSNDFNLHFAAIWIGKNKLFTIIGMILIVLGLLIFGSGIYLRLAYSPTNIQSIGSYKQQFEQLYYGGLAAIIVGAIMDIFGWILIGLTSLAK
jgi:hypothetical protein